MSENRKPTWVYVATSGGLTKVGISCAPARRMKAIRSAERVPVRLVWVAHRPRDARRVELTAHRVLAAKRVRGEWFKVTASNAIAVIEAVAGEGIGRAPPPRKPSRPLPDYSRRLANAAAEFQAWIDEAPAEREAEVAQAIEMLRAGNSVPAVADALGVSKSLIYQRARGEWAPRIAEGAGGK